jgi:hypothetical protein
MKFSYNISVLPSNSALLTKNAQTISELITIPSGKLGAGKNKIRSLPLFHIAKIRTMGGAVKEPPNL